MHWTLFFELSGIIFWLMIAIVFIVYWLMQIDATIYIWRLKRKWENNKKHE